MFTDSKFIDFQKSGPLQLAEKYADLEGTALFYSGGALDSAQFSYLCLFPDEKISLSAELGCWEKLKERLGEFNGEEVPRWIGYLGYEMGCYADVDRKIAHLPPKLPSCCFYRPRVVIKFDHQAQKISIYGNFHFEDHDLNPSLLDQESFRLTYVSDTLESYLQKIAKAKDWILDGEIYQVNLSQEMHFEGKASAFHHFRQISALNPAPFSVFMNCGSFSIVSSSPERFLKRQGSRLETRPIKGTAPRSKCQTEDQKNREELLASEKERAELLMITDLMRNDLGKVSLPGSVKTQEIWRCESYTNVHHLVSIIQSECDLAYNSVELIRELFPGGSITGCPKLRVMEAITELEGRPRDIYTGSIGYFSGNGDFDFNIVIRTAIFHSTYTQIQLGGAIVIDSDPIKEFEETLHKGHTLLTSLGVIHDCLH